MAIAVVQSQGFASATSGLFTLTTPVTAGNTLVVFGVSAIGVGFSVASDTTNGKFADTQDQWVLNGTGDGVALAIFKNSPGGNVVLDCSVFDGDTNQPADKLIVYEISGADGTYEKNGSTATIGTTTVHSPNALTTTADGELLLAFAYCDFYGTVSETLTTANSFTDDINLNGATPVTPYALHSAYRIQATQGAVTLPVFTGAPNNAGCYRGAVLIGMKVAPPGVTVTAPLRNTAATGLAPAVTATSSVTAPLRNTAATGLAPTVTASAMVTAPAPGNVVVTGLAPTLVASVNATVTAPAPASTSLVGYVPLIYTTGPGERLRITRIRVAPARRTGTAPAVRRTSAGLHAARMGTMAPARRTAEMSKTKRLVQGPEIS